MVAGDIVKDSLPNVLAMLLHIGAAYVGPADSKDSKAIFVLDDFVLPPVHNNGIPAEHQKPSSETVDEVACFQCRFKLAVLAWYNSEATKKVLCNNCYETVNDEGKNYIRVLLLDELERQVMQEIVAIVRGQTHHFMDTKPPQVTPLAEVEAPVFDEAEIRGGLKFMLDKQASSVKCNNDPVGMTVTLKRKHIKQVGWKQFYWSTTVDQVRAVINEESLGEVGVDRRAKLRSFRDKVEKAMEIMAAHPDKDSITQFGSGRGVLILFGGNSTSTHLHLDISGALTYQFKVSSRSYRS